MLQLNKQLVNTGQQCPYCGKQTKYVPGNYIYGAGGEVYGWFYICDKDEAWVGCHKYKPTEAKGRLANKELRYLKIQAHDAFDKLWNKPKTNKSLRRTFAYRWLALQMHLPVEETHIGMMNEDQCKSVCMIASQTHIFEEYLKQQI